MYRRSECFTYLWWWAPCESMAVGFYQFRTGFLSIDLCKYSHHQGMDKSLHYDRVHFCTLLQLSIRLAAIALKWYLRRYLRQYISDTISWCKRQQLLTHRVLHYMQDKKEISQPLMFIMVGADAACIAAVAACASSCGVCVCIHNSCSVCGAASSQTMSCPFHMCMFLFAMFLLRRVTLSDWRGLGSIVYRWLCSCVCWWWESGTCVCVFILLEKRVALILLACVCVCVHVCAITLFLGRSSLIYQQWVKKSGIKYNSQL